MYPDNAVARDLFGRVGGVLVSSEEETLDAFSAATATFAAHLDYLTTITVWLADHGVDHRTATAYTTHIFGQLGQALLQRTDPLTTLTDKHATPDGINEQLMTDLPRRRPRHGAACSRPDIGSPTGIVARHCSAR